MTRGLLTAGLVVVVALAIGPASSGLKDLHAQRARGSDHTGDRVAMSSPRVPTEPPIAAATMGSVPSDAQSRPTLTMAPRNSKLEARLSTLLPEGVTVREASRGFEDHMQFASAVHVSRNLDIPFADLKAKIVDEGLSVGQAIQVLRPDADVWRELTRARDMTSRDLY
jgi:hypothetical protein